MVYRTNLRKAMLSQLKQEVFNTFIINNNDTITNPNYYSKIKDLKRVFN